MSSQHFDKPNIVMVMADQMTAFALSAYGNRTSHTPHLDRLAEQSVVFEQAYCNSPLCAPARFTLMSGQQVSQIGAYDNAAYFPSTVPTFAHYLRAAGYQTCLAGKMHFIGPDQLHGFEQRLTTDIYPADFGWVPDWENFAERSDWWYHNMLSVKQAGVAEITNQYEFDDETCAQARQKIYDLARTTDPRPFALCVSFTHPHDPYATRRKYWDLYAPDAIDLPAVPAPAYEQRDPHSQRLHHISDMGRFEISDEEIRNARRAYYGNVSYIDDCFGQLLDVLQTTGLDKNTLILFTSDHGDMLGEHGLWYKMTFREWACRVPLMVYAPGRYAAHRVTQPVSHVDILPTLLDLAGGMEPVEPVAGHSLQGLLEGGQETREVIGEYTGEGCIAPLLMIRREQYKYVYCEVDPPQLFDLASDPLECHNLAAKPEYQALAAAFQTEVLQRWDPVALRQQVLQDQKRRRFLAHTLSQGAYQSWDFQPQQDASQRYMRNHLDLNELEFNSRFPRARLFS